MTLEETNEAFRSRNRGHGGEMKLKHFDYHRQDSLEIVEQRKPITHRQYSKENTDCVILSFEEIEELYAVAKEAGATRPIGG